MPTELAWESFDPYRPQEAFQSERRVGRKQLTAIFYDLPSPELVLELLRAKAGATESGIVSSVPLITVEEDPIKSSIP